MGFSNKDRQHVKHIATDVLSKFKVVAEAAQSALHDASEISAKSLASVNTSTKEALRALQRMGQINSMNRESNQTLVREPAIARVVVADQDDKKHTYYICRATPTSGVTNLASYRAPVGRLASLPIGTEFTLPNGTMVEVLEQAQLHPSVINKGWDSRDTIIEGDHFGPITIESLRALPRKFPSADQEENLLEQLLAEESQSANLIEGVRRSVITKMGLRDQPVLDQYQDEIFRLPLDKRLLILGPPGTGKTTTLIRRLGQKLDTVFLGEDERHLVENLGESPGAKHAHSWLMFTPTDLLKQYLKEAFAREGVPASDLRIRTWADYRRELARNTFGVLKTAAGGGSFVLKESVASFNSDALDKAIAWFSDFDEWQRLGFIDDLRQSAQGLSKHETPTIADVGKRLLSTLDRAGSGSLTNTLTALAVEVNTVRTLVVRMKGDTDKRIKRALNIQLNRNKAFIDELVTFIDELQLTQEVENEDQDDQEGDEEDTNLPTTGRSVAVTAYMQAVRAQSRARARKKSLAKNSRNGRIVDWLGDRTLDEAELVDIGNSVLVQTSARRFVNPVKRYIDGIPRRYKSFRRLRQKEGTWYHKERFNQTDLNPLELDVILLAILRGSNELLSKRNISRDIEAPVWSSLKPVLDLYNNQVLVDEATDFSPVQIACMAALSHPKIRSFFACGDFNQRLTTWGSRSIDEMKWVFPEIEVKEITVSYRQSRQLNELAHAIIDAVGGADQGVTLPSHVDSEGVAPTLLEGASESANVVDWLAQRVREIERFVGQLPSIAVFVESELEVEPLADALNEALAGENTQVVACSRGQVMGQDNDVRVFDVQHIKGLEFEAVFFIGVDRLAVLHPQLFDKYLYVGTTRAATYLGVTCDDVLPPAISTLRPMFISDWKTL